MPSTDRMRSHTMKVMTVCGPRRAKLAAQPLKKPAGPSVCRTSKAHAIGPLYLLPPAGAQAVRWRSRERCGEGQESGAVQVKRAGGGTGQERRRQPAPIRPPTDTLLGLTKFDQEHYSLTKMTVLITSIGFVTVVATRPARMLLVRCVVRLSPHPLYRTTQALISS